MTEGCVEFTQKHPRPRAQLGDVLGADTEPQPGVVTISDAPEQAELKYNCSTKIRPYTASGRTVSPPVSNPVLFPTCAAPFPFASVWVSARFWFREESFDPLPLGIT